MYPWKWLKILARHSLLGRIMLAGNTQFSLPASPRSLREFHCSGKGNVSQQSDSVCLRSPLDGNCPSAVVA